jgi:hypothetical protein
MTPEQAMQALTDAGFTNGWSLLGDVLTVWEHDTEPPAPFVRPQETTNEATTTDADTVTSAE